MDRLGQGRGQTGKLLQLLLRSAQPAAELVDVGEVAGVTRVAAVHDEAVHADQEPAPAAAAAARQRAARVALDSRNLSPSGAAWRQPHAAHVAHAGVEVAAAQTGAVLRAALLHAQQRHLHLLQVRPRLAWATPSFQTTLD